MPDSPALSEQAASLLSRYIQINTTNPPGAEHQAAEWLAQIIAELDIPAEVQLLGATAERPALLARIGGDAAPGPALVLNHHMDVVPADGEGWSHPPFAGEIADGYVWGRGALDCKGQGIIFLLALARLASEGAAFTRPVVYLAVPDEEAGGLQGSGWLVEQRLQELDPAWVWDEGSMAVTGMLPDRALAGISVAEKRVYHIRVEAEGEPGHGSRPSAQSAPMRLLRGLAPILEPRPVRQNAVTQQMWAGLAPLQPGIRQLLLSHLDLGMARAAVGKALTPNTLLGAMMRDTISLTQLSAGTSPNVIPARASAVLDCRLLPDTRLADFVAWLRGWLDKEGLTFSVIEDGDPGGISPMDGGLYRAIAASMQAHVPEALVVPLQMPAASDARFYRRKDIPAYGLTPIVVPADEVDRVHGIDERLSLDNLALGIQIAYDVIKSLCTTQE